MKTCTLCKCKLPASAFDANRAYKDGLHSCCKECRKPYDLKKRLQRQIKDPQRYSIRCPLCAIAVTSGNALSRHLYAAHPMEADSVLESRASCTKCGEKDLSKLIPNNGIGRKRAKYGNKCRSCNAARYRAYHRKNPDKSVSRQYLKIHRQPPWADVKAIRALYAEVKRRNRKAGCNMWSVDHIVPIRGKNVSGLHIDYNLRIMLMKDNSSKGNKLAA